MNEITERRLIVSVIFLGVGVIFLLRLFWLQVVDSSYKVSADNNVLRYNTDYPARGVFYDRNGKLLVYNKPVYDLMITPKQVKMTDTAEFCSLLNITVDDYISKFTKAKNYSRVKSSIFEKQLSPETYATLQEKLYKFPGFFVQSRTVRKYLYPVAAHLFGYIGEVDSAIIAKKPYYREGDYIGKSGIEQSYEEVLRGKRGVRVVMVDAFNREKGSYEDGRYDTAAVPGENLTLTIDARLQLYGEELMQNKTGGIVAIDPQTGEILACISTPAYDPNLLVGRERTKNFGALFVDPYKPLFNRALMAYYPPGSTFKLINDLIGLQEGTLFPSTTYYCDGGYHMGSQTVKCDARHGSIALQTAIEHSCNTYHCYVFRNIMDQKKFSTAEEGYLNWRKHVLTFGIGKRLFSDLPQELKGNVPSVEYYDKYFGKGHWKSSTVVSLSIGQGELGITPLQMANTMCIISNKGFFYIPHILRKIGDKSYTDKKFLERNYTDVDSGYYNVVVEGMQKVLESGTAAGAKIAGINVCGKTGTAQNPHGKDHSLFVGFAPRENPRIAIGIMVENGGWGASWAAPIASLMIEKYLTDSITRPDLEKRMKEGVVIPPVKLEKPLAKKDTLKAAPTKKDTAKVVVAAKKD
jgi:penicillin-binding protein 2